MIIFCSELKKRVKAAEKAIKDAEKKKK